MFISRKKAIAMLRREIGLTEKTCAGLVDAMPKLRDRSRDKIHTASIEAAIDEYRDWATSIKAASGPSVRFSGRTKAKIRRMAA